MHAARDRREQSRQHERRRAERRSDSQIFQPTWPQRAAERAKWQSFKKPPAAPADQRRGNQNGSVTEDEHPMAVHQFRNRTMQHQSQPGEQKYETQSGANVEGDDEQAQPPAAAQMTFVVEEKLSGVHRAQHSSILAARQLGSSGSLGSEFNL